ncbi:hypothetical protein [Streptomyces adelaidensis]|uniref:hypothetical protein n=1 Tax=Streptomyces adelaidensis TaxID=2796465 RepID=UPI0019058E19|nr:hypothetical protein [Streptomyces adelaidensis]
MTKREFGEIVQGPMTPDGPSVDEIRAMRPGSPGSFHHRDGRTPLDSAVIRGESVHGDGAMTEDQADQIRKAAGIGRENAHAGQVAKSYSEHRDRVTGQAIRTYEDGRTEIVDESRPATRVRGGR